MVTTYSQRIEIAKSTAAIANLGLNWDECWRGLLKGERPFINGRDRFADWPDCPPMAVIDERRLPDGESIPFSDRFSALIRQLAREVKPTIDAMFKAHSDLNVTAVLATSGGDPGYMTAMVDSDFRTSGQLEPVTPDILSGMASGPWEHHLCEPLGRYVPTTRLFGACAASLVALSYAADRINAGLCDAVLIIGIDTVSRFSCVGFTNIGANASNGCIPFDSARDGTTVGEGAVAFIVARADVLPRALSAARVVGTSVYCDAGHLVEPSNDAVVRVMTTAFEQAQVAPTEIKGVFWHGTGTKQNDKAEAKAAATVFGDRSPPCTSTKGSLGHTMGASAGFNLLAACESFASGVMPPTAGTKSLEYPNLDVVIDSPRPVERGPMLVTALGFGGINAAAVIVPSDWTRNDQ